MQKKILIIEDDISFGEMLRRWVLKNNYLPTLTDTIREAQELAGRDSFDLVLTDLRLPDGDGILFLSWLRETKKSMPVIVMTGYGKIQSAVAAMKLGAFDYLEKPVNPELLKQKIEAALGQKPASAPPAVTIEKRAVTSRKMILGKSRKMQKMYDEIATIAPTRMSVLITGESGTGKEYAARMIHENSPRKDAPFIAVDCGVLSRELAPSELFGHMKGSFTSAVVDKSGVFEQAAGGTVFLDEIENLPYEVQVQLLRALQELRIRPVGGVRDIEIDVRIVAATNEDLEKAVAERRFREDLYHRLNEFTLHIPPLRERAEDLYLYAAGFLEEANSEMEKMVSGISDEAMELLSRCPWSGNLRELRNVIRRAVLFTKSGMITSDVLPGYLADAIPELAPEAAPVNEKERILTVLRIVRGNKAEAARMLKISRKTLYNKMHQYDIEI